MLIAHRKIFPLFVLIPLCVVTTFALGLWVTHDTNFFAASPSIDDENPQPEIFAIDRIEGDIAVLHSMEDNTLLVPADHLPPFAQEGDLLKVQTDENGAVVKAQIDWEATRLARKSSQELLLDILAGLKSEDPQ